MGVGEGGYRGVGEPCWGHSERTGHDEVRVYRMG